MPQDRLCRRCGKIGHTKRKCTSKQTVAAGKPDDKKMDRNRDKNGKAENNEDGRRADNVATSRQQIAIASNAAGSRQANQTPNDRPPPVVKPRSMSLQTDANPERRRHEEFLRAFNSAAERSPNVNENKRERSDSGSRGQSRERRAQIGVEVKNQSGGVGDRRNPRQAKGPIDTKPEDMDVIQEMLKMKEALPESAHGRLADICKEISNLKGMYLEQTSERNQVEAVKSEPRHSREVVDKRGNGSARKFSKSREQEIDSDLQVSQDVERFFRGDGIEVESSSDDDGVEKTKKPKKRKPRKKNPNKNASLTNSPVSAIIFFSILFLLEPSSNCPSISIKIV